MSSKSHIHSVFVLDCEVKELLQFLQMPIIFSCMCEISKRCSSFECYGRVVLNFFPYILGNEYSNIFAFVECFYLKQAYISVVSNQVHDSLSVFHRFFQFLMCLKLSLNLHQSIEFSGTVYAVAQSMPWHSLRSILCLYFLLVSSMNSSVFLSFLSSVTQMAELQVFW